MSQITVCGMKKRPLEEIPGVGPKLAREFADLGIQCVGDLQGRHADELYDRLVAIRARPIDRCVLYVFRSAVYYADGGRDPQMLKWWNWKGSTNGEPTDARRKRVGGVA